MTCGMTCEMNTLEIRVKFVFSLNVILLWLIGLKVSTNDELTLLFDKVEELMLAAPNLRNGSIHKGLALYASLAF